MATPPKTSANRFGLFGGFKGGKSQKQKPKAVRLAEKDAKRRKKEQEKQQKQVAKAAKPSKVKTGKTPTNKIPTLSKSTKKVKDSIVLDPTGTAGISSVTGARFEDQSLKTKVKSKLRREGRNKYDENGMRYWEDAGKKDKKLLISEVNKERKEKLKKQKDRTIRKVNRQAKKITNPNNVIPRQYNPISTNDSILNDDISFRIDEFYSREDINEKNQPGYVKKELTPEILVEEYTKLDENKIDNITELDIDNSIVAIEDVNKIDREFLENNKQDVTKTIQKEDGSYTTETGKLIGIISEEEEVTTSIMPVLQEDLKAIIPGVNGEPPRPAKQLKEVEETNYTPENTELVYAFEDGSVEMKPLKAQTIELPDAFEIRSNIKDVENEIKRDLFYDTYIESRLTDDLFKPDPELFMKPVEMENQGTREEKPSSKKTIDTSNKEIFNSAVNNLPCKVVKNLNKDFNNSQFAAYGFYYDEDSGRLYGNIDKNEFGEPITGSATLKGRYSEGEIYTGSIQTPEGEDAPYILIKSDDSPSKGGFGVQLKIKSANCDEIKSFLDNEKTDYNKDFDNTPLERYDDIAKQINNTIAEVKSLQASIANDNVDQKIIDITDKINSIEDGYKNSIYPIVEELAVTNKELSTLRTKYEKSKSKRVARIHDEKAEEYNSLLNRVDSMQEDFFDKPLSELRKKSAFDTSYSRSLEDVTDFSKNPETIVETESGLSFVFKDPKADGDGGEALIYEEQGNLNKSLSTILSENRKNLQNNIKRNIELDTKKDYANVLLKDLEVQIHQAGQDAIIMNEEYQEYLKEKDPTLAQGGAFAINTVAGTIEKLLPGAVEIIMEITEGVLRLADNIDPTKFSSTMADLLYEAEQKWVVMIDDAIDDFKLKPGGATEFDQIENNINAEFWGKAIRTILEVAVDLYLSLGLGIVNKANKIKKGAKLWEKVQKHGVRILTPGIQLPRIVLDQSLEIQRRVEQTGIELKPAQRLGLTIGVGTIISILDKLGLEQVAKGPGATKIITQIFSKSVNKIPGETQKQTIKRVILELVDKGIITTTKAAAVEIPTEVAQTIIELVAKGYVNGDFEKFDYFQVPTSKEEWREVLGETAILSAIAAGGISTIQSIYNGITQVQDIRSIWKINDDKFVKLFALRDDGILNQVINSIEVEQNKDIAIAIAKNDLKAIEKINNDANKRKEGYTLLNKIMKKVPVDMEIKQQQEVYHLEQEKQDLLDKKKNNDLGIIETNKINERIKEIDKELLDIANVKVESDISKEIDKEIEEQKEKRDEIILDPETSEEAGKLAEEAGFNVKNGLMVDNSGKRVPAVIGPATKGPNKGKIVVIYDKEFNKTRKKNEQPHEGDHLMIRDFEKVYGDDITFKIANQIAEAINNGSLTVSDDFKNRIERYKEQGFKDKALADEIIANLGDDLESGKATIKEDGIIQKLENVVINIFKKETGLEIDLGDKNAFIKFLQKRRETKSKDTPKLLVPEDMSKEKTIFTKSEVNKSTKKPKKTKPSDSVFKKLKPKEKVEEKESVLYSIDSSTDLEAEIKKIVEKNKKLLENKPPNWRERAATNTVKSKELRKLLELSKENEKQISIIKDPNSSESQVERAKNKLVENNMPGITDIIKKNFDSRKGTSVTYDDFKAEVLAAFSDLINTYDINSGVPFGAYVFGKMKNKPLLQLRIPGIFDKLINTENVYDNISFDELQELGTQLESGEKDLGDAFDDAMQAEEPVEVANLRKALGIEVNSDIYNEIKEEVKKALNDEKLDVKNPKKYRTRLKELFRKALTKKVTAMMGTPGSDKYKKFLDENSEAIYKFLPQSIMNKSFQDFTKEVDKNLSPIRVDEEIEKRNLPPFTPRTSGPSLMVKLKFDKDKFVNFHLKPEKGTPATKQTQLAQAIATSLAEEATADVLKEEGRSDAIIAEITNIIDRDPTLRFSIDDVDLLVENIIDLVDNTIKQGGDPETLRINLDALSEEEKAVAIKLLEPYFTDTGKYKDTLKKALDDGKIPSKFKNIIERVVSKEKENNKLIYSTDKRNKKSMQEMHDLNMELAALLPPELVDLLGPAAFGYDYTYMDAGYKKQTNTYGPFKKQFDKFKAKSKKSKVKSPSWVKDVKQYNAGSGVMARIETILNQDLSKDAKIEKLKEKGLWNTLLKANDANIKATKLIIEKITLAVANNPELAAGAARLLEGQTNLTKSLRSLTTLSVIEISDKPQGAYISEDGKKSSNTPEKGYVLNRDHPHFEEAEDYADEKIQSVLSNPKNKDLTEQEIANRYEALVASKLRFKGEHLDPAAPLMEEILEQVLNTASEIIDNPSSKDIQINELNTKLDKILDNYTQILGTITNMDKMDAQLGSTSSASDLRLLANDLETKDYILVDDPESTISVEDASVQKIINKKAIEEIVEFLEIEKPENRFSIDNSGVIDITKDTPASEIIGKMKTLDESISKARRENAPIKKARLFDFDDTVAISNSLVFYTMPDGTKGELTAEEFANQGSDLIDKGAVMDFTDFNKVRDGKKGPLFDLFKKVKEAKGDRKVYILTARAPEAEPAIRAWLESEGIDTSGLEIIGLGNGSPLAKANFIVDLAAEGFNDFYFADDVKDNVDAVQDVLDVVDVKSQTQQAKMRFAIDGEDIADELFKMTAAKNKDGLSVEALKNISDVKAGIKGSKIRDEILMAASAQNFTGLLYRFLGKGDQGDADFKFLKDNLIDPYTRAMNEVNGYQTSMLNDYNEILKTFVGKDKVIKKLQDEVPGLGGYTYQDMVRVLAWDSQGVKVEGLPQSTLEKMRALASKNPAINTLANQLVLINKGDEYYYPGENWRAGTIKGDLLQGISKIKRPKAMEQWLENIKTIFGEYSGGKYNGQLMNAIEATYGSKYREALEDMLRRMTTGQNRRATNSKLENRFYDWVNNSVGAVMFFNMRSGLLQTLSAANYINWSFNNPAKAAGAFANQKQYWKDFMELMNSDFLVDRRAGLKINVSESEVFNSATGAKDKASGVLNMFLKAGFSITQVADSFAIASGGATFYRNRIKDLVSQGKTEADAKKQAYDEWTALSREAQQSSDALEVSSQQAGGLGRILLAFANTPMQYNRIIYKAASDIKNGRGDLKTNLSRIAYYGAIQNLMFNALQQAVFAAIGNEDEEEIDEKTIGVLNGMLDSLLKGMGVSGTIVSTLKDIGVDVYDRSQKPRPEYDKAILQAFNVAPPIDVKISKARRAANTYEYNRKNPAMKDAYNINNPAYMSTALMVAAATNVPLDRLLQKMINVNDAMREDQENWKSIMLVMGWSEWQLNSKQENDEKKQMQKEYYESIKENRVYNYKPIESVPESINDTDPTIEKIETKEEEKIIKTKGEKVNFTENKSFKNNRVPVEKRNKSEKELYELPAAQQRDSLKSLGLTDEQIKALKYEGDRVRMILELQK